MDKLIKKLLSKKDSLKMHKSESGLWMVKRNFSILYIGTKEKCEIYLTHLKAA